MNKKIVIVIVGILIAFGVGYLVSNPDNSGIETAQQASNTNDSSSEQINLDLSGQQLTTLPTSVTNRTDVRTLDISNNQLTTLPASIGNMKNLNILIIENNRIESLPAELNQLKNLQQIRANNNRMIGVPPVLNTMVLLDVLDLSGNNIPSNEIKQLKSDLPNTQIKP